MGAGCTSLSKQQLAEIQAASNFEPREIKRLFRRFQKLDINSDGGITAEEFSSIPELAANPLAARVIELFDRDNNKAVDFADCPASYMVEYVLEYTSTLQTCCVK